MNHEDALDAIFALGEDDSVVNSTAVPADAPAAAKTGPEAPMSPDVHTHISEIEDVLSAGAPSQGGTSAGGSVPGHAATPSLDADDILALLESVTTATSSSAHTHTHTHTDGSHTRSQEDHVSQTPAQAPEDAPGHTHAGQAFSAPGLHAKTPGTSAIEVATPNAEVTAGAPDACVCVEGREGVGGETGVEGLVDEAAARRAAARAGIPDGVDVIAQLESMFQKLQAELAADDGIPLDADGLPHADATLDPRRGHAGALRAPSALAAVAAEVATQAVALPDTLEEVLDLVARGSVDSRALSTYVCDRLDARIPPRIRWRAYAALLGVALPARAARDEPLPSAVADAVLEPIRMDLATVYAGIDESIAATPAGVLSVPASISLDEATRRLGQFCAAHHLRYSSTLAKLLGPVLVLGAPDADTVFALFHAILVRVFPAAVLASCSSHAAGAHPADVDPSGSTDMYADFAAASRRGSTSSVSGAADVLPPRAHTALVGLRERATALHGLTRMVLAYTQPALVHALDVLLPSWWRPTAGPRLAAAEADQETPGCIPHAWLLYGFVDSSAPAHAVLPLLDRMLFGGLASLAGLQQVDSDGDVVEQAIAAAASPAALISWPPSDAAMANVLLAASLVAREAPSLQVVATTHTPRAPAHDGTGAESLAASHKRQSSAGASNAASYLVRLTLDGAPKRCLWLSSTAGADASLECDAFMTSTTAWLQAGTSLARELPLSFRTALSAPADVDGLTAALRGTNASSAASDTAVDDSVAAAPACLRITADEVATQLVYGWRKVSAALASPTVSGSRRNSILLSGPSPADSAEGDAAPPTPAFSFQRPVRVMLVDVRPVVHRRAGRIATAFHIDPRTCLPAEFMPSEPQHAGSPSGDVSAATETEGAPAASAEGSAGSSEAAPSASSTAPTSTASDVDRVHDDAAEDRLALAREPASATPIAADSADSAAVSTEHVARAHDDGGAPIKAWQIVSAGSAVGLPLEQAVDELVGLSGSVHLVIVGVGVRTIPAAYEPRLLDICATQDDVRIATVARALLAKGVKCVSVLDGGFAALHDILRYDRVLAPAALQHSDGAADAATDEPSRVVLVDHIARKCAPCRHTTVTRLLERSAAGENVLTALALNSEEIFTEVAAAAKSAGRAVAGFFGNLQRRMQEHAAARKASRMHIDPAPESGAAAAATTENHATPGHAASASSRYAAFVEARDKTVSVMLAALRNQERRDAAAKRGHATPPPTDPADAEVRAVEPGTPVSSKASTGAAAAALQQQLRTGVKSVASAVLSASKSVLSTPGSTPKAVAGSGPSASSHGDIPVDRVDGSHTEVSGTPVLASRTNRVASDASKPPRPTDVATASPGQSGFVRGLSSLQARLAAASSAAFAPPPPAPGVRRPSVPEATPGAPIHRPAAETVPVPPAGADSAARASPVPHAGGEGNADARRRGSSSAMSASGPPRPAFTVADALSASSKSRKSSTPGAAAAPLLPSRAAVSASFAGFTGALKRAAASAAQTLFEETGKGSDAAVTFPPSPANTALQMPTDPAAAVKALQLAGAKKGDLLDLQSWSSSEVFQCTKEKRAVAADGATASPEPVMLPRYVCLIRDRLVVLEAHPTKLGFGVVKSNHHLTELAKLSFSKKSPQRVVLWYRRGAEPTATAENGAAAADAVRETLVQRVYHFVDHEVFKAELQSAVAKLSP